MIPRWMPHRHAWKFNGGNPICRRCGKRPGTGEVGRLVLPVRELPDGVFEVTLVERLPDDDVLRAKSGRIMADEEIWRWAELDGKAEDAERWPGWTDVPEIRPEIEAQLQAEEEGEEGA